MDVVMDQTLEEYLTFSQFLAQWVGSAKTLRRRLKDGSIPYYQPGGPGTLIAIPRSALGTPTSPPPERGNQQTTTSTNTTEAQIPGPKPRWRKRHAK